MGNLSAEIAEKIEKLQVREGDILVFKIQTSEEGEQIQRLIPDLDAFLRDNGIDPIRVMYMGVPHNISVENLSEDRLREHGWVRKEWPYGHQ